jgi:outer membrane protein TolC
MSGGGFWWIDSIQVVSEDGRRWRRWLATLAVAYACTGNSTAAQAQSSQQPLTIVDAIELARKNYPSLKEIRARSQAAQEGVAVARAAYIPRLDALWQANRGTHNNVFGLVLPQNVIPSISGPVLGTTIYDGVWGSAAGVLLSWQAVDFGLRKANVQAASAQASQVQAVAQLTELDVTAAAADAFVSVLAADEAVRAVRANVDRLQTFAESVRVLVRNQLRPGADESRANAELAIAQNQLSQAVQTSAIARATLADAIGSAGAAVTLDVGLLSKAPSFPATETPTVASHPAVRAELAGIEAVEARERALARSYVPRLDVQGAFSGRGTGAEVPGQEPLGNGLTLDVPNWAIGLTVSFPVFEGFTLNARRRVEAQNELAQRARHERAVQTVTTQQTRAQALMTAATEIARNTPVELKAAADAESRARARYSSGLTGVTEVADAQRLLAQAETDDALARLGVWRALLALSQAAGDLNLFLERVRQP